MTNTPIIRRRSPDWVRVMERENLHALASRLQRDFTTTGLTEGQDKLLSQCVSELEWRHVHPGEFATCYCDLCIPPFPWEQLDLDDALKQLEGTDPF